MVPTGFFIDGSLDGVSAYRNNAGGVIAHTLFSTNPVATGQSLAYGQIVGPYDARLRVGYGPFGIEGRELGGFQWKAKASYGAAGDFQLGSFSNFGATNLTGAAVAKFESREVNLRFQALSWLTPFVGYRQIRMSDQDVLTVTFPAFSAPYDFDVPWEAEGAQIGAEARLFGPGTPWAPWPVFADVDARIGEFDVSGANRFNLTPSTGGSFPNNVNFSRDSQVIYELGAALGYQLTQNIEIRAGYRFLAIPDAPFAAGYAAATTSAESVSATPSARTLDLQMATLGLRVMLPSN
jgi:opacity protein-like surface antigen